MLKTLTIKKKLTPYNFTKANNKKNKYIVIHYYGAFGTAKNNADYFASAPRTGSAHLFVDETKTVWQSIEYKNIAWHCGTKNGYKHPSCRNSNSIGIEARPSILDRSQERNDGYQGWYFNKQVEDNLLELVRHVMQTENIPASNVIRHYDVTGKYCPRPWMGTDYNIYYNTSGDEQWRRFKQKLEGEEEVPFTQEDFDKMYENKMKRIALEPGDDWSKAARDWAVDQGYIKGTGTDTKGNTIYQWKSGMSREQVVQFMYNYIGGRD